MVSIGFLIAALVLFILAGFGVPSGRFDLIGAGLACWAISLLVARL